VNSETERTGPLNRHGIGDFLRTQKWAVVSTVSADGVPQSAVVGIAVNGALEVVFDTLSSSRKAANLRANPRVALVAGGLDGSDRTVQYEGLADFPVGDALEDLQRTYYAAFPDGRDRLRWPGLVYVRVTPRWVRFSDFSVQPPVIVEFIVGDEA
jgi:general stress protein 26